MTPTLTMLMVLLSGPGVEQGAEGFAGVSAAQHPFTKLREARAEVSRVLRESNRAQGHDPADIAPSVVAVYRQLGTSEYLPVAERRRLQSQLRTRLSELEEVMRRRESRAVASHSGGVVGNSQDLINLIQTTIEPDSWEINGGKGTIFYFPNR